METLNAIASVDQVTMLVTPYLPLLGTLAGAAVVGAFAVWNRKRGATETRAPDVNQIWQQQAMQAKELDKEYRWRRRLQYFSDEVLTTFRGYVRRVQHGGSTELTPHERLVHDADSPTSEINVRSTGTQ